MTERIETEVAILGGGIVGGSAALFLRRQGAPVVLLEAALCGARASGVNYGGVRRQGRGLEQMPLARRAHELWGWTKLDGLSGEYQILVVLRMSVILLRQMYSDLILLILVEA